MAKWTKYQVDASVEFLRAFFYELLLEDILSTGRVEDAPDTRRKMKQIDKIKTPADAAKFAASTGWQFEAFAPNFGEDLDAESYPDEITDALRAALGPAEATRVLAVRF